jgi:Potential Queuosine, Q, salvage protein family
MSDDEVDPELLALFQARFGIGGPTVNAPPETKVLKHAEYISDNSVDVMLDMYGTKNAAAIIGLGLSKRMAETTSLTDPKQEGGDADTDMADTEPSLGNLASDQIDSLGAKEINWAFGGWHAHPLHPPADWEAEDTLKFIFMMDLLNFCFWSELSEQERFAIEYHGKKWTGYNSLVAALRRALDEGNDKCTHSASGVDRWVKCRIPNYNPRALA